MALNMKKLKKMGKEIKDRTDGNDLYLYANKLGEEDDVRIMSPTESLNGSYFIEQEGWWIAGNFYGVASTFGGADVIQEEIDIAKASGDIDLKALVEAKKNGMSQVKKEWRYLMPILALKVDEDDDDKIEVIDDMIKVLVAKTTLLTAINKIVCSRHFQNDSEDGITDRVIGHNLTLSKTGKGLDTEYAAQGWNTATEMDKKYYDEPVDVVKLVKDGTKSDKYLRSVIRNYLYGEDILEEKENTTTSTTEDAKTTTKKVAEKAKSNIDPRTGKARVAKTKKAPVTKDNVEEKVGERNVLDDAEEDLNDLD